jgi:putative ABC transport system permease protein
MKFVIPGKFPILLHSRRIALGAQKKDTYCAILGGNGRPVFEGLLVGMAIKVATCTALASMLRRVKFGANVQEPGAYASAAILLAVVALGAMLGPARRASKVDPVVALRYE